MQSRGITPSQKLAGMSPQRDSLQQGHKANGHAEMWNKILREEQLDIDVIRVPDARRAAAAAKINGVQAHENGHKGYQSPSPSKGGEGFVGQGHNESGSNSDSPVVLMRSQRGTGLEPIGINFCMVEDRERPGKRRVVITSVMQSSLCGRDGRLQAGDEILRINGQNIESWRRSQVSEAMEGSIGTLQLVVKKEAINHGMGGQGNDPVLIAIQIDNEQQQQRTSPSRMPGSASAHIRASLSEGQGQSGDAHLGAAHRQLMLSPDGSEAASGYTSERLRTSHPLSTFLSAQAQRRQSGLSSSMDDDYRSAGSQSVSPLSQAGSQAGERRISPRGALRNSRGSNEFTKGDGKKVSWVEGEGATQKQRSPIIRDSCQDWAVFPSSGPSGPAPLSREDSVSSQTTVDSGSSYGRQLPAVYSRPAVLDKHSPKVLAVDIRGPLPPSFQPNSLWGALKESGERPAGNARLPNAGGGSETNAPSPAKPSNPTHRAADSDNTLQHARQHQAGLGKAVTDVHQWLSIPTLATEQAARYNAARPSPRGVLPSPRLASGALSSPRRTMAMVQPSPRGRSHSPQPSRAQDSESRGFRMSSGEREMLLVERESLLVETGRLKSDRDRVTKDRDRLVERVAGLESEKARLGIELDELSDQCAQLRTEKIRAEGMGKGSDIRAMSLDEDVKRMTQEATEMKFKLADMERRLGDSERRARGEEARANEGEAKLASMERLVEESSEACNLQRHRCNILRALVETFRSEPASVMADSAVSDTGRGLRGAVDLSEEGADGEPAVSGGEAAPFSLWRTVAEQRAEIVDLNADLEEANQRVAILQEDADAGHQENGELRTRLGESTVQLDEAKVLLSSLAARLEDGGKDACKKVDEALEAVSIENGAKIEEIERGIAACEQAVQSAIALVLDHVSRSRAEKDQLSAELTAKLARAEEDKEELRIVLKQSRERGAGRSEQAVAQGIHACGEALGAVEGLMKRAVAEARNVKAESISAREVKKAGGGGRALDGEVGEMAPETPPRRKSRSGNNTPLRPGNSGSPLGSVVDTEMSRVRMKRLEASVRELEGELERSVSYAKDQERRVENLTEKLHAAAMTPAETEAVVRRCEELEAQVEELKKHASSEDGIAKGVSVSTADKLAIAEERVKRERDFEEAMKGAREREQELKRKLEEMARETREAKYTTPRGFSTPSDSLSSSIVSAGDGTSSISASFGKGSSVSSSHNTPNLLTHKYIQRNGVREGGGSGGDSGRFFPLKLEDVDGPQSSGHSQQARGHGMVEQRVPINLTERGPQQQQQHVSRFSRNRMDGNSSLNTSLSNYGEEHNALNTSTSSLRLNTSVSEYDSAGMRSTPTSAQVGAERIRYESTAPRTVAIELDTMTAMRQSASEVGASSGRNDQDIHQGSYGLSVSTSHLHTSSRAVPTPSSSSPSRPHHGFTPENGIKRLTVSNLEDKFSPEGRSSHSDYRTTPGWGDGGTRFSQSASQMGTTSSFQSQSEELVGVGLTLMDTSLPPSGQRAVLIHSMIAGKSADLSGCVEVGSTLIAVDGREIADMPLSNVRFMISGEQGSYVRLQLLAKPHGKYSGGMYEVTLRRGAYSREYSSVTIL